MKNLDIGLLVLLVVGAGDEQVVLRDELDQSYIEVNFLFVLEQEAWAVDQEFRAEVV